MPTRDHEKPEIDGRGIEVTQGQIICGTFDTDEEWLPAVLPSPQYRILKALRSMEGGPL